MSVVQRTLLREHSWDGSVDPSLISCSSEKPYFEYLAGKRRASTPQHTQNPPLGAILNATTQHKRHRSKRAAVKALPEPHAHQPLQRCPQRSSDARTRKTAAKRTQVDSAHLPASGAAPRRSALAPTRTAGLHQGRARAIRGHQTRPKSSDLRPGLRRDEGRGVLREGRGLRLLRGPGRVARLCDR